MHRSIFTLMKKEIYVNLGKDHRPVLHCSQLFPDAIESGVGTGSAKVVNAAIDGVAVTLPCCA